MTMRQAVVMVTSVLMMLVVMKSMMKAQVAGKWSTNFEKSKHFHHFSNTNIVGEHDQELW